MYGKAGEAKYTITCSFVNRSNEHFRNVHFKIILPLIYSALEFDNKLSRYCCSIEVIGSPYSQTILTDVGNCWLYLDSNEHYSLISTLWFHAVSSGLLLVGKNNVYVFWSFYKIRHSSRNIR